MGKADVYSWKARGAAVRDARHTHDGPEGAQGSRGKDTRRWCKGKVGREHRLTVTIMSRYGLWAELVRHCSACGKDFGTFWRSSFASMRRNPPDWATRELLKQLDIADAKIKLERERGRKSA
jgi:hypothetical protein